MAEIKVVFSRVELGKVEIEASGFSGPSCTRATEFLRSLGAVTDYERKAEYYEESIEISGAVNGRLCG